MGLFQLGKKKEGNTCSCGGNCDQATTDNSLARFKVLGSGCVKCKELEQNLIQALKELNVNEPVGKVSDFAKIAQYGVMTTPAIVFDEKVLCYGKVLKVDEIKKLIEKLEV